MSIVAYHSRPDWLIAASSGLAKQTIPPCRVVVHANDESRARAQQLERDLRSAAPSLDLQVTASSVNRGFAAAHNHNLAQLFAHGCEGVVVHNPDLVLSPEALERLVAAHHDVPGALFGPVLERADPESLDGTGLVDTLGIRWTKGGRHLDIGQGEPLPALSGTLPVQGISGACLFVSRSVYERIMATCGEFFDETFFAYREDAELGLRAALLGVGSYVVAGAHGRHVRRLRGTTRGADPDIDRLGVRNRFLLAAKYGRRRPGGLVGPVLRDCTVVIGVVVRERHSWSGIEDAWRLRKLMRLKGRRLRVAATAGR